MKKKIWVISMAVILLLTAIGITLYPLASNWYSRRHQSQIHTQYQEQLQQADTLEIDEARQKAAAYNTTLTERVLLSNAFSEAKLADALENYNDLLNMTGNGIMGYVVIPSIGVSLPIYHGTDDATLEKGIGHLMGSSLPVGGESTHTILTGHSGLSSQKMFSDLPQLQAGDVFYLEILNQTLVYQVAEINTVLPYDTSLLGISQGEDACTLVTCTPFGVNTHRLLVKGYRIPREEAEVIVEELSQKEGLTASTWEQEYIKGILMGLGIVFIAGLIIIVLSFYRKFIH